ncbi:hypothetical protein [Streptomyces sp. NPDC014894]|uniref:hypothetical protein n=1 Tax=Streptomyces sp. NPDC014894 TaxID=3364931 RepID=UPI0036FB739E
MRRVGTGVLAGLVLAAGPVGCGADDGAKDGGRSPVIEGSSPAPSPYPGPLWVADRAKGRVDGSETEHDPATWGTGAAGRAVECAARLYGGGPSEPWSEGDGGGTPEEGLKLFFEIEQPDLPQSGYRVERTEGERVLYSLDVKGRTKVAVIVAKDRPNRPGWGPETTAWCDPAELPAGFAESKGYEVWTDRDGRRVPVAELSSGAGPEHCDWQKAHFLQVGAEPERRSYGRDPDGVLPEEMLTSRYEADVTMPGDARDTGRRLNRWELWMAADDAKAYVRTPRGVEAWPAVRGGGCA